MEPLSDVNAGAKSFIEISKCDKRGRDMKLGLISGYSGSKMSIPIDAIKHAENVIALLKGKEELSKFAGHGRRQGKDNEGAIK